MKNIFQLILFALCLLSWQSNAQSYSIVDIDASRFPIVEASISTSDINFNPKDFLIKNVSIVENDLNIVPLECSPPKNKISAIPISLVLALDISGSMSGHRFEMLKMATKKIIEKIPLEVSEVAVASFNKEIMLNCDFTHNKEELLTCIDSLYANGGTDFMNAFFTPEVGLTDVAKLGVNKKVIIFISDGMDQVAANHVSQVANRNAVTINTITVGVLITPELIDIANQTGGKYFSDLNSEREVKSALGKIYYKTQEDIYGKIKWRSALSCKAQKHTEITLGNQRLKFDYEIPESKVGSVQVSHSEVFFKNDKRGEKEYHPIFIKGHHVDLNITSIKSDNDALFGVKQSVFPIKAPGDEQKMLELYFISKDSILSTSNYVIKNEGCPDVVIQASAGGRQKLVVTHPKGGEEYVSGTMIPIKWNGITRTTEVEFYYQAKGFEDWKYIGSANSYKKDWKAPAMEGEARVKGVVSGNITFSNIMTAPVSIIDGSEYKSAIFNKNTSEILSLSTNGTLKSWVVKNGKLKHTYEHPIKGDYAYFPKFNRLVDVSDQGIEVYTNRNGLSMKKLGQGEGKNVTSLTHIKDKELYITLRDYVLLLQDTKYLDVTSSPFTRYRVGRSESKLYIGIQGQEKKEFSIKLAPDFQRSILHRTQPVLAVWNQNNTQVYHLKRKGLAFTLQGEDFCQFSRCSKFIITQDSLNYHFYTLNNGNRVLSLDKQSDFAVSPNSRFVAEISHDSLVITDISTKQKCWEGKHPDLKEACFFPVSNQFLFLQKDSLLVIDLNKKKKAVQMYCESELIKDIDISADEKMLLVTCDKVIGALNMSDILQISNLGIEKKEDIDITPYFNIVTPKPQVLKKITFDKQFVGNSKEQIFTHLIKNLTEYSVVIDSIYIEDDHHVFEIVSRQSKASILSQHSYPVEIRFTPVKTGLNTAKLIVVSAEENYECLLEGEGMKIGYMLLSHQVNFGNMPVGIQKDMIVPVLKNIGSEPLLVNKVGIGSSSYHGFSVLPIYENMELNANDTLWVKISFKASQRGRKNAVLKLKLGNQDWINASRILGEGTAKRKVVIAGETINATNKNPLSTLVRLKVLESGRLIKEVLSGDDGKFEFEVNCDINYSLDAHLKNFFSSSENIDLTGYQKQDTIRVKLELTPINSTSTVRLNNIFFEFAKARLLEISKTELQRLVLLLKSYKDVKVEVHGHTDNIGSDKANMQLSKQRALAVKEFLVVNGISEDRILVKYFGETKPVQNNTDESGRKANRRVEIQFVN